MAWESFQKRGPIDEFHLHFFQAYDARYPSREAQGNCAVLIQGIGVRLNLPLWLIPMAYAVASLVVGILFPQFEYTYLSSYSHAMSVSSAQAFLSSVASGMMALTAIVFSISFLMVQFSASAYSKRLILLSGRDPVIWNSMGVFFATFIYALATLPYVDRHGDGKVPYFSTLIVAVLLALSVILLALLIHSLAQLQITQVLRMVGDKARTTIRETFSQSHSLASVELRALKEKAKLIQAGVPSQTLKYSGAPRAVADFDIAAFVRLAQDAGAVITMDCAVGDTLAEGAALIRVFGAGNQISDTALLGAIDFAVDRTFKQDLKYPLRLLVDTAIMALSPAVNDPTSAVQSIDQIEDLLHRLGQCDLDAGYIKDTKGELRFVFPMPTWEDYLSLGFDEIRMCGSKSLQVLRRMRSALNDLLASLTNVDRVDAVRLYLRHLDDTVAHSGLDELDRAMAMREDRQGLGVTRRVR